MGTGITLTSGVLATVLEEAARALPFEACGVLLGRANRVEAAPGTANVHPDPAGHFEIDPVALVAAHKAARAGGPHVLGYWHSHPNGRAEPSDEDRAAASGDGRAWLIVADDAISVWIDTPEGFKPLPYAVVQG